MSEERDYRLIYYFDRFGKLHLTRKKGNLSRSDLVRTHIHGECRVFDISEPMSFEDTYLKAKEENMKIND